LQLNPAKTEVIWFGSRSSHRKTECIDLSLYAGDDVIKPVSVVRDLGVLLDEELMMKQHINVVANIAFYHIRRLKNMRYILGPKITANLVSAFVRNTDWNRPVFAGLPATTIAPLQQVQNSAARFVKGLSPRDHTSALRDLHWLPIQHVISY